MKKPVLAVLSSLLLALPAFAQQQAAPDPAALQAAREMLVSMHYDETAKRMMQQMSVQMPQVMHQSALAAINGNTSLTAEQRQKEIARLDTEMPKMTAALQELLSDGGMMDAMMAEMAPLYARHFTADELHQLTAFYQTPVGAKTLAVLPQIAGESMQISQRVIMPRIQALAEKLNKTLPK